MKPVFINSSAFIWVEFVLILAVNLGVVFGLSIINSPKISKFIQPLFISLFLEITIYFRGVGSSGSLIYLFLLTFLLNLLPDSVSKNEERDLSEQENDSIDNNRDNRVEEIETNQEEQQESDEEQQESDEEQQESNKEQQETNKGQKQEANKGQQQETNREQQEEANGGQNQSFLERLKSVNFVTAFFVLLTWFSSMESGISASNYLRFPTSQRSFTINEHYVYYFNEKRKVLINLLFANLFNQATYQFVYCMFVQIDNPPKWLYFIYMIPRAVLYPLSALFAFYVADHSRLSYFPFIEYSSILGALHLYFSFKMVHQFIQSCKGEGNLKDKIIPIAIFAVGFLWLVFTQGIYSMNSWEDNYYD